MRIFLRVLVVAAAVVVVAVAALPWWLPAALSAFGERLGVSIGDWETHGWRGTEYHDVTVVQPGLRVNIDSLRLPVLGIWPRSESGDQPPITGREIAIAFTPIVRPPGAPRPPPPSMPRIGRTVLQAWSQLEKWAPAAQFESIIIESGPTRVQLDRASWDGHELRIAGVVPGRTNERFNARLSRPRTDQLQFTAETPAWQARLAATASLQPTAVELGGDLSWENNHATLAAHFGDGGLAPESARLDAPELVIDPSRFGVAQYQPVRGGAHVEWTNGSFTTDITARARPTEAEQTLPPLELQLHATGDPRQVAVEALHLQAPGISADLSAPVRIELPSGRPQAPAQLGLSIDLAQIPWIVARGSLTGKADVSGGPQVEPAVQFEFSGSDLGWREGVIDSLRFAGRWTPALLEISEAAAQLSADSRIEAHGAVDLNERRLQDVAVSVHLASAALTPWLPQTPAFRTIDLQAHAEGPLIAPESNGRLAWSDLAGLPGGALSGELTWSGTGPGEVALEGEIRSASGASLPLALELDREDDGTLAAELERLAWRDAQGEWWRLAAPAPIRIQFPDAASPSGSPATIEVSGLRLEGDEVRLSLEAGLRWPEQGHLALQLAQVDLQRLAGLLPKGADMARVDDLHFEASWNNGPVDLTGAARATLRPPDGQSYALEAEFRTGSAQLALGAVRVLGESGVVLHGDGELPLRLAGREDGFSVQLPRDGPIALTLESTPNPKFWESVSDLTGWTIAEPRLQASISGSLQSPRGRVSLDAAELRPATDSARRPSGLQLPELSQMHVVVSADDSGVSLENSYLAVEGQWIDVLGHAPWPMLHEWRRTGQPDWSQVRFHLASQPLPVEIASRFFPTMLAPEGAVSLSLDHEPGAGFQGRLWLHGAATRPIQPVGAIRDINAEMRLDGYDVHLVQLRAQIGARPIEVTGTANIRHFDHPDLDLRVTSGQIPLVRQEGMVVRAELNLRARQTADGPGQISGDVTLGPSLYVSDLVSLVPTGGVREPERRPPYFSVKEQPFAAWTLDVHLQGDDFLHVQNPLFNGTVSADFQLGGTLAEPRAVGRAWAQEGRVNFPFASLGLQQLEVTLTPQNPFQPALFATGSTRVFGYDVRMEVTGTANDPRLQFSSDPPMSSQSAFLMLTTGALPEEAQGFTTSERAQRLAFFIGKNLVTGLGLGGNGGGAEDNLTVRSGENFTREGRETIYVQYDLTHRWSLVGEYDRFDAYNGGIKFRLIDR